MFISIGQIVCAFGIGGEVKVRVYSDDIRRFEGMKEIRAAITNGDSLEEKNLMLTISGLRYHKDMVLMKFHGIDDMTAAENLKNALLQVAEHDLPPLPEGRYYIYQLIGLSVWEKGNCYGKIIDVMQPGSNDVYLVKNDKKEILVPALKTVIKNVDLAARRMEVELPAGLLEIYT